MNLSIVMAGRNDGYCGDFLQRTQSSIDRIFVRASKYNVKAELVIVDWNPPPDRPSFAKAIKYIFKTIPVRVVTVPHSVHVAIKNSHKFNLFEYWAKNAGIRRSSGKFVLSMNPDVILSENMVKRLSMNDFDENCFYRANRHDVLDCKVIRVCMQGDEPLHYNASGDFTMMARDKWEELRGYPEVSFNKHVDSHLLLIAHNHGMKQVVFPDPIFHQEHDRSGVVCDGPDWKGKALPQNGDWGLLDHPEVTVYDLP